MREREIPNDILFMFEAGIDIALLTPHRTLYDDDILASTYIMADTRVMKTMIDDSFKEDRWEASA